MELKCKNKKCLYKWNYKGNSKFYATCPKCMYKVHIKFKVDKKEKKVMELLVDCFSNDLIEIYKTQGEKSFRVVAESMGLKKKEIDAAIKDLK